MTRFAFATEEDGGTRSLCFTPNHEHLYHQVRIAGIQMLDFIFEEGYNSFGYLIPYKMSRAIIFQRPTFVYA